MMIFLDGFDYLTAANFNLKWDSFSGAALQTGIFGVGKATTLGTGTKTLGSNFVTGFNGWHFYTGPGGAQVIHRWRDAGTDQVTLNLDATLALFFTRAGTTIGSVGAPSTRLVANTWYWIETQVKIDATTGIASVNVNGNSVLSQSGLNTKNTANAFFNQLVVTSGGSGQQGDSYHFWDGTVSSGNDPSALGYGEHVIDSKLPNAVGSNSAWTPNGAGNNFTKVNEANEDGDTTYVSTNVAANVDSYGFANVTVSTGTIGIIAINTIDRIDDAGPHTFDHFTLSAGSTHLSGGITPGATYVNHQSFVVVDPNTGAAWTIAGRNAAEFGYKFIS